MTNDAFFHGSAFGKAMASLTPRQREILRLTGQGFSSKEIGHRLGLSPLTVDSHISAATRRLGVTDRRRAARLFVAFEAEESQASIKTMEEVPSDQRHGSSGMGEAAKPRNDPSNGNERLSAADHPHGADGQSRGGQPEKPGPRPSSRGMRDVVVRYVLDALYVAMFFLVMSALAYGLDRLVELAQKQHIDTIVHGILRGVAIALAAIDGIGVVIAGSLLTYRFLKELLRETA